MIARVSRFQINVNGTDNSLLSKLYWIYTSIEWINIRVEFKKYYYYLFFDKWGYLDIFEYLSIPLGVCSFLVLHTPSYYREKYFGVASRCCQKVSNSRFHKYCSLWKVNLELIQNIINSSMFCVLDHIGECHVKLPRHNNHRILHNTTNKIIVIKITIHILILWTLDKYY